MNTNIFTQNETVMNAIANAASLEEIRSAVEMLANDVQDGELNDAQLDNVSGGIALATCYIVLNCCMVAMAGKPLWLLATMGR